MTRSTRIDIVLRSACIAVAFATVAPVCAGVIAHYKAEGNANDSTGAHNGAPVNGAGYGTGVDGQAFALNGFNQYVVAPDSPAWAFGSAPFTVAVWANFTTVKDGPLDALPNVFVGQDEGGGTQDKWVLCCNGTGALCFHINGPASVFMTPQAAFTPTVGDWHHFAVTRSGNAYTFYYDGASLGTAEFTVPIPDAASALLIGQAEGLGAFDGRLDDVQIYDRALSASDMQYVYMHPGNLAPGEGCPPDLNGDGNVDGADLGMLLADWGSCGGCGSDLNADGTVDGADLGALLASWGLCP